MLRRSQILLRVLDEQQPVPVDPEVRRKARTQIGGRVPGMERIGGYPAGQGMGPKGKGVDAIYPDSPDGRKIAEAHAWLFPSKITKAGNKTYRT